MDNTKLRYQIKKDLLAGWKIFKKNIEVSPNQTKKKYTTMFRENILHIYLEDIKIKLSINDFCFFSKQIFANYNEMSIFNSNLPYTFVRIIKGLNLLNYPTKRQLFLLYLSFNPYCAIDELKDIFTVNVSYKVSNNKYDNEPVRITIKADNFKFILNHDYYEKSKAISLRKMELKKQGFEKASYFCDREYSFYENKDDLKLIYDFSLKETKIDEEQKKSFIEVVKYYHESVGTYNNEKLVVLTNDKLYKCNEYKWTAKYVGTIKRRVYNLFVTEDNKLITAGYEKQFAPDEKIIIDKKIVKGKNALIVFNNKKQIDFIKFHSDIEYVFYKVKQINDIVLLTGEGATIGIIYHGKFLRISMDSKLINLWNLKTTYKKIMNNSEKLFYEHKLYSLEMNL